MTKDLCDKSCIDCGCMSCGEMDQAFPEFCLTTAMDEKLIAEVTALYNEDEANGKLARTAAEVEAENYCRMTRIEETIEFARKMGFHKIGIATCVGLMNEARTAAKIFRAHGFEVFGAACKVGAQEKVSIGIDPKCESAGRNMCNPILQAKLLNEQRTELNVVIGLCIGHDSLFYKYAEAPVTTLVVKDRVLGHNPAAALYCAGTYYSKLLGEE